jgi:hypothetical protein
LILVWLGSVLYLKHKWLYFVERTIDENHYSFSSNFFLLHLGFQDTRLPFNLIGKQDVVIGLSKESLCLKGFKDYLL